MNVISELAVGLKDHYLVYEVLKSGGFVRLSKTLGLYVELMNGYAMYSLVAIGKEIDDKVLYNMNNQRTYKPKVIKQEVLSKVEEIEDEDLFSGEQK